MGRGAHSYLLPYPLGSNPTLEITPKRACFYQLQAAHVEIRLRRLFSFVLIFTTAHNALHHIAKLQWAAICSRLPGNAPSHP